MTIVGEPERISTFWEQARAGVASPPEAVPEAWAFGATAAHADGLLALVLEGTKTGTASAVWDYEAAGEAFPEVGECSIILDGHGEPRAVIRTTWLCVVPFGEVDEEHAFAEGEGDRTLASWREIHERFWTEHGENPRGFERDMPVLCERFELIFAG